MENPRSRAYNDRRSYQNMFQRQQNKSSQTAQNPVDETRESQQFDQRDQLIGQDQDSYQADQQQTILEEEEGKEDMATKQPVTVADYNAIMANLVRIGMSPKEAIAAMKEDYVIIPSQPIVSTPEPENELEFSPSEGNDSAISLEEINALLGDDTDVNSGDETGDEPTSEESTDEEDQSDEEPTDESGDMIFEDLQEEEPNEGREGDSEEGDSEEEEEAPEENGGPDDEETGDPESDDEEDPISEFLNRMDEDGESGKAWTINDLPGIKLSYNVLMSDIIWLIKQIAYLEDLDQLKSTPNWEFPDDDKDFFLNYLEWVNFVFYEAGFYKKKGSKELATWQAKTPAKRGETLLKMLSPVIAAKANVEDWPKSENGKRKDFNICFIANETEARKVFEKIYKSHPDKDETLIFDYLKQHAVILPDVGATPLEWSDPQFRELYLSLRRQYPDPFEQDDREDDDDNNEDKKRKSPVKKIIFSGLGLIILVALLWVVFSYTTKKDPEIDNNIGTGAEGSNGEAGEGSGDVQVGMSEDGKITVKAGNDAGQTGDDATDQGTADQTADQKATGQQDEANQEADADSSEKAIAEEADVANLTDLAETKDLEAIDVKWIPAEPGAPTDLSADHYGKLIIEEENQYSCYAKLTPEEAQSIYDYMKSIDADKTSIQLRFYAAPNGFSLVQMITAKQLKSIIDGEYEYVILHSDCTVMYNNSVQDLGDGYYTVFKVITVDEAAKYLKQFDEDPTLSSINIGDGEKVKLPNGTSVTDFSITKDQLQAFYDKATAVDATKLAIRFLKEKVPGFE